jgi:hypothetical protein
MLLRGIIWLRTRCVGLGMGMERERERSDRNIMVLLLQVSGFRRKRFKY